MNNIFSRLIGRFQQWRETRRQKSNMRVLKTPEDQDYGEYLDAQFDRSWRARNAQLRMRAKILIEKLQEYVSPSKAKSVLCLGCRSPAELDHFEANGFSEVIGVDLFSTNERIKVMDMHSLKFPDNRFDVVYASHSLEHAYDFEKVCQQIDRVCKATAALVVEVPLDFETSMTDRVDFKTIDGLTAGFVPHGFQVVWTEEANAQTSRNDNGTRIGRGVMLRGEFLPD